MRKSDHWKVDDHRIGISTTFGGVGDIAGVILYLVLHDVMNLVSSVLVKTIRQ